MFIQTAPTAGTANLVLDKSENRPAGRIGDFGNFFIVLTKSPLLLPYMSHRSRFFRLNSPGMENSLNENVLKCGQFYNFLLKGSACFDRPGY